MKKILIATALLLTTVSAFAADGGDDALSPQDLSRIPEEAKMMENTNEAQISATVTRKLSVYALPPNAYYGLKSMIETNPSARAEVERIIETAGSDPLIREQLITLSQKGVVKTQDPSDLQDQSSAAPVVPPEVAAVMSQLDMFKLSPADQSSIQREITDQPVSLLLVQTLLKYGLSPQYVFRELKALANSREYAFRSLLAYSNFIDHSDLQTPGSKPAPLLSKAKILSILDDYRSWEKPKNVPFLPFRGPLYEDLREAIVSDPAMFLFVQSAFSAEPFNQTKWMETLNGLAIEAHVMKLSAQSHK